MATFFSFIGGHQKAKNQPPYEIDHRFSHDINFIALSSTIIVIDPIAIGPLAVHPTALIIDTIIYFHSAHPLLISETRNV